MSKPFPFQNIVLVADPLENSANYSGPVHMRPDLEMTDENTIRALLEAFSELNLKAYHYYDPQTLGLNAEKHKQDLVLSIYGGQGSRNRMALVPAICEINGIHYVGPDVYGRVICQDKEVSKHLANQCGLKTPEHRIIRGTNDLDVIRYFPTPFVVKPIMEGSSIGIGPNSLVHKSEDGIILAKELFESLRQPIMVEAFVSGREVSYNCIEAQPENLWTYSEIHVEGREDYFDTNLFDAEEKLYRRLPRKVRTIDAELSKEDRTKLNRLLETIGRFSYCRVDGKSREGEFVFLEITPDAWIAPTGAFAASFMNKGWPYADVIKAILSSVIINPHDQLASG